MLYGVEILGSKQYGIVGGVQERYVKWTLGLDKCASGYVGNVFGKVAA